MFNSEIMKVFSHDENSRISSSTDFMQHYTEGLSQGDGWIYIWIGKEVKFYLQRHELGSRIFSGVFR